MEQIIPPLSTIGIIGGGQLGRMMAQAAAAMGYRVHIFTPEQDSPASQVADKTTVAQYTDLVALRAFASSVNVVTFEFENIPHTSLEVLESKVKVCPSAKVLELSQNRLREKSFINGLGIATAQFAPIYRPQDIPLAQRMVGSPAILKTTELGYDGKGQVKIDLVTDPFRAWEQLKTEEAVLEAFVDFRMEISVIIARGREGNYATYVPVQNEHKNHILDTTTAPAAISEKLQKDAQAIAIKIAEGLNLVGLLAVEMFVTKDDRILVNELAPRPHNSGHWTMDACITSQFEQAIRAICGLPLGSTDRLCDAVMKNLIGEEVDQWREYLDNPQAKLHLYGKKETRAGRKMGHVNILKKA